MSPKLPARSPSSDVILGMVFAGIGILYGVYALRTLPLGTAREMGSGYFPVMIAALLTLCGLWNAVRGWAKGVPLDLTGVSWRAIVMVTAATVLFAATINGGGLVIATTLAAVAAGLASPRARPVQLIVLTGFLVIFCSLVFVVSLRLPIGLLGTWFR